MFVSSNKVSVGVANELSSSMISESKFSNAMRYLRLETQASKGDELFHEWLANTCESEWTMSFNICICVERAHPEESSPVASCGHAMPPLPQGWTPEGGTPTAPGPL